MNKIVNFLTHRVLVAIVVGLFLLSVLKSFSTR